MSETILVTGGAGFIGRQVVREALQRGNRVRALDSFVEQVHGPAPSKLDIWNDAELLVGDLRDPGLLSRALARVDSVIHLAAEVGVGQSMYEIERYVGGNDLATASLFQALIDRPVRRVVTASSMSIYGEGLYRTESGDVVEDAERGMRRAGQSYDPLGRDGRPLFAMPTPEWKRPALTSVYALTKYVQERLTLTVAPAYGIEAVALRLFNVYGPGQALSNPYTGVLAIFASRLLNGERPMVFEDGQQRRDFVHVKDVARAFLLALEHPAAAGKVFNIGSGRSRTVEDVAIGLAQAMNRTDLAPEMTGKLRAGDIRHCFAAVGKAEQELGFAAEQDFSTGLAELADWVAKQEANDRVHEARRELEARGLVA
ncbi:MAG: NAD-dependent epimerase/dehydratase family protein [Methylobacteriaceae bacterium]|nr:NAD-dependent epimerase/dehydratase family protein [Methylobacteriaceae bacterium]